MITIDKIYCINLDRRPDRWLQVKEQFNQNGLEVERVPGVDGRKLEYEDQKEAGNAGCTLSHLTVLTKAHYAGYDCVMVFEDDAVLHENFNALLGSALRSVPEGWDILYLGGSHRQRPEPINDHISSVTKTFTTHGYIIRRPMFEALIMEMSQPHQPVDCYFVEMQPALNCYVTNPPLAWQRGGLSDIQGREMEYDHLKSNEQ